MQGNDIKMGSRYINKRNDSKMYWKDVRKWVSTKTFKKDGKVEYWETSWVSWKNELERLSVKWGKLKSIL